MLGGEQEHSAPFFDRLDRALKRAIDIALAALVLVLASPVIAGLALAIRLDSPGPAFYRCRRVGLRGGVLYMLKFRKMHDGAAGPALSSPDAARFNRFGIVSTWVDGNGQVVYLDDLSYTIRQE